MTALVPEPFSDHDKLAEAIHRRGCSNGIIGIDGWLGAGKTTLAKLLAEKLSAEHFDLDDALHRDQGAYFQHLDFNKIRSKLSNAPGRMVVSGVCFRQVLELVSATASVHIYVKRMALSGWPDEHEIETEHLSGLGSLAGNTLRAEVRTYHAKYCPHETTDFEFHWREI